ncbi:hypothetical protein LTR66_009641, partial [Elasticomyces elasticus]
MSDCSSVSDTPDAQAQKRNVAVAGFNADGIRPTKSVKRRASKACQCCRARKVRCNVVEHGAPCTNCRLDEIECIVSESKRKKKWSKPGETLTDPLSLTRRASMFRTGDGSNFVQNGLPSDSASGVLVNGEKRIIEHVPHALYQSLKHRLDLGSDLRHPSIAPALATPSLMFAPEPQATNHQQAYLPPNVTSPPVVTLPPFIKPLPSRIGLEEIMYLEAKGALTIPEPPLRNELLRCFVEFVHPYMPLVDIQDLVMAIDRNDGSPPISLLLFQSIMFAGIATVDMRHLRSAGYATRRDARRRFFQKTRILYDFDYEPDRISLIQSLLLMTYWYETPDDQKDSHHWMGIAVSLSHTIGLHRNPQRSTMDPRRQGLWKRIWWSTFMRDRLIALGMRRPTRIKDEDFDVPMLTIEDFDITALPEGTCIPADCNIVRDTEKQRQLAIMCIEKAKLCRCIGDVLATQYSVVQTNPGSMHEGGNMETTMKLGQNPNSEFGEVQKCDDELQLWKESLDDAARYHIPSWQEVDSGNESLVLHRALLHMVYYATLSALHRPHVLPSAVWPPRDTAAEILEVSRRNVRYAATEITKIAQTLYTLDLVRYMPTTGITVLLPAIIIHLLDIKAPDEATRRTSLQGFCQCMQIMAKLRDIYAAADYSTAFLEAAIRKAEISLPQPATEMKQTAIATTASLVDAGRRMHLVPSGPGSG